MIFASESRATKKTIDTRVRAMPRGMLSNDHLVSRRGYPSTAMVGHAHDCCRRQSVPWLHHTVGARDDPGSHLIHGVYRLDLRWAVTPVIRVSARWRSIAAVIASVFAASLTFSICMPLLSLILEQRATASWLIGLNNAAAPAGLLIATIFMPRIVEWLGTMYALYLGFALMVVSIALLPVFDNVWAWFPLRFTLGIGTALHWVVSETWINTLADDRSRGRVMAVYVTSLSAAYLAGLPVLLVVGTHGILPFVIVVAILCVAVLPLVMARNPGAPYLHAGRIRPLRRCPTGTGHHGGSSRRRGRDGRALRVLSHLRQPPVLHGGSGDRSSDRDGRGQCHAPVSGRHARRPFRQTHPAHRLRRRHLTLHHRLPSSSTIPGCCGPRSSCGAASRVESIPADWHKSARDSGLPNWRRPTPRSSFSTSSDIWSAPGSRLCHGTVEPPRPHRVLPPAACSSPSLPRYVISRSAPGAHDKARASTALRMPVRPASACRSHGAVALQGLVERPLILYCANP